MAARSSSPHLLEQLRVLHVEEVSASTVVQLTDSLPQALTYLDRDDQGQLHEHHKHWKELYCLKNQRLYYVNNRCGYNSWDAPPCFQFQEWQLDAALYGLPITLSRDLYTAMDRLLLAAPPETVQQSLSILSKLVSNVAACNNTQPQYRSLKLGNPKLQRYIWALSPAAEVLTLLGWTQQPTLESTLGAAAAAGSATLPADAALGPIQAAAARLQRLADKKGHSGQAEAVSPDGFGAGSSGRPASQLYGTPGYLYQEQIWHCSVCDHPINDGSERLWTGRADAPRGEYRFHCSSCTPPFNLCETCWDAMTSQAAPIHPPDHAFEHIGPRMTRHNDYYGAASSSGSGGDAWGRQARPVPSRALARLRERTGVQQ